MKKIVFLSLLSLSITPLLEGAPASIFESGSHQEIIVPNNRILAKVHGTPISVIDVMKKMDMIFYRQFPQYASINAARFQFYEINWKHFLDELINKELIIADAKESKIEVTTGEVRKELQELFGPNLIENLDKMDMSYEEASKIVEGDILLKKMMGARVHSKAIRQVTPSKIKTAYEGIAKDPKNHRPPTWEYQVLTFRDSNPAASEQAAFAAYEALVHQHIPMDQLENYLKTSQWMGPTTSLNVSETFSHTEEQISKNYKDILFALKEKTLSAPVEQKSRDSKIVYRLFFLAKKTEGGPPSFKEIENQLTEKLIEAAVEEETESYFKRLRKYFDIHEIIPKSELEEMQPFALHH